MIDHPKLRLPCPRQTNLIINVDVLRIKEIGRYWGYASSAGRHHAPGLAAEKLKLVLSNIDPIKA